MTVKILKELYKVLVSEALKKFSRLGKHAVTLSNAVMAKLIEIKNRNLYTMEIYIIYVYIYIFI